MCNHKSDIMKSYIQWDKVSWINWVLSDTLRVSLLHINHLSSLYNDNLWSGRTSPGGKGDANRHTRQNPNTSFTHLETEQTQRRGQRQDSEKQETGKTGRSRGSWGTKIHIQTIWNEALTARTRRTDPGLLMVQHRGSEWRRGRGREEKWEEEESHTAWKRTDKTVERSFTCV